MAEGQRSDSVSGKLSASQSSSAMGLSLYPGDCGYLLAHKGSIGAGRARHTLDYCFHKIKDLTVPFPTGRAPVL